MTNFQLIALSLGLSMILLIVVSVGYIATVNHADSQKCLEKEGIPVLYEDGVKFICLEKSAVIDI